MPLSLRRGVGEKIIIAGNIVIEVQEIKRGSVRLGITAPEGVTVNREEVHKAIQEREAQKA